MPINPETLAVAWQYQQAAHFAQAEHLYRQALQQDPSHAEAWRQLGKVVQALGRVGEAMAHFRQAIALQPHDVKAYNDLGIAQAGSGQLEEAERTFRQAVTGVRPDANAANNLGVVLGMLGRAAEAAVIFRQALAVDPANQDYCRNLANALREAGCFDDAIASFRQALQLNPHSAATHTGLANAFRDQGKMEQAFFHYRESLRLQPNYANAHLGLGMAFEDQRNFDEAIACYHQALHYKPDFAEGHNNLGNSLLRQGHVAEASACFEQALRIKPGLATAQSNLLFCRNYDPDANPDTVFQEHSAWGRFQEARCFSPQYAVDATADRHLRIGYVSPDLRRHAVTRYLEPVLAHHDRSQMSVFCYAEVALPDEVTHRLEKLAQGWRWTTGLTDAQLAEAIHSDKIDILVDLAGHSANNRLRVFALKPAPIQATWLGYLNTTGLTRVDYRLTDEILDPPGQPRRDTEVLFRLPGGFCCFAPPADAPPVGPLPALRKGHLTFGSLHNLFKLNSRVFDLWAALLTAVPDARLLMFRHTLTGSARDDVLRQLTSRGIAAERLDLRQGTDSPGYLEIYNEIDVGLDAFPCSGGVTTCESLWMGVPVLSLCGARPISRNSAALLARVGLGAWAVQTPERYVAMAEQLENELESLAKVRETLRAQVVTNLCDAQSFTKKLEEAYRTIWRRWCTQQKQ